MTSVQLNAMNTELWQNIGSIADSELMMKRLTRYAKRLARERADNTLMTKEDFLAKIERAEQQYANGEYTTLQLGETVEEMLIRSGYAL